MNKEVIKAWCEGREIQYNFVDPEAGEEGWKDYVKTQSSPFGPWWCSDEYQWRVKPQYQKTYVVVVLSKEYDRSVFCFKVGKLFETTSESEAEEYAKYLKSQFGYASYLVVSYNKEI